MNFYHLTPTVFDPDIRFYSPRLISVESEELGLKLGAEELTTYKPFPNKGYVVGSLKLSRNRKARGILVVKPGEPILKYSVSYLWEFEISKRIERTEHKVDYEIMPKKPIPKTSGNLFTDDAVLWSEFEDFEPGGGLPSFYSDNYSENPRFWRLCVRTFEPGMLLKNFTCRSKEIWTPNPENDNSVKRIKAIKTLGATLFPMVIHEYFPISWGSWQCFLLKEEGYPSLENTVELV